MNSNLLANIQRRTSSRNGGFTLVEIVTVITIIVILIGILVPIILSVQRGAKRVKSQALFGKLITSLTLYQKDHGAYPDLQGSSANGDMLIDLNDGEQWARFAEILALSQPDGSAFENPENQALVRSFNPKFKRYFDLQLSELEKNGGGDRLVDAFGNPHIFIVVDANLDGRIDKSVLPGDEANDLRQRVVVFTSIEGNDDFEELKSWDS